MQAPSSGDCGEMRMKGSTATPADSSGSKPQGIPVAWAEKCGKGRHLQSQVTMSSLSAWVAGVNQGKDQITRIMYKEREL